MNQEKNLNQIANTLNTRDDFVEFVHKLSKDFQENPSQWENDSLERYLEAIAAWSQDMDGYFKNTNQSMPENINWKIMGQILLAAKIYE